MGLLVVCVCVRATNRLRSYLVLQDIEILSAVRILPIVLSKRVPRLRPSLARVWILIYPAKHEKIQTPLPGSKEKDITNMCNHSSVLPSRALKYQPVHRNNPQSTGGF